MWRAVLYFTAFSLQRLICSDGLIQSTYSSLGTSMFDSSPRKGLPFVELAHYDGHAAQHHYVTTSDGYILSIFRIPPSGSCDTVEGVLLFMHGLYLSSDDCIIPGPGQAHCYIYSNNCYDVWAPNARGNFYSRNHTTYDPDHDSEFWNFSFDEMAIYDLPASIDYVLAVTGKTQLSFVGHSQGVTMLLILCSKMPEYNAKIKVGIGLSVTAWVDNAKFVVIGLQGALEKLLTPLISLGVNAEILARGGPLQSTGSLLCGTTDVAYPFCSLVIFAVLGYNRYQITEDTLPAVVGHTPSGTSLKNFNRWGQIKSNGFVMYDYGSTQNMVAYGQSTPPEYDLANVTMRWVFVGSLNDYVANITDVKLLVSKLSNVQLCVLSDETFGHLDFIYGKNISNYIAPTVLWAIANHTLKCV